MAPLYDPARHDALAEVALHERGARDAIAAICREHEAAFEPGRLWPLHPQDWDPGVPEDGILRGLYLGAAGVVHGLERLAHAGLYEPTLDHAAIAAGLYEPSLASPDEPGAGPSLLVGSTGILVVAHRLTPSAETADLLAREIEVNVANPANELLLGAPGTMLVARVMHERTGDARFAELWRASAATLLARQEDDGLWTQELYGSLSRYVGSGHGFSGNVRALIDAPEWLDDRTRVEARAVETVTQFALVEGDLANWAPEPGGSPTRVQWCHGSPGIAISLARLAPGDDEYTALLEAGGELAWRAGPIAHNAGLCHGTAGNGFAFLALHERTGDVRWLRRAEAFAAHALQQVERFRAEHGAGRQSLFTGDLGAALLAAACLDGDARFPGIDDL